MSPLELSLADSLLRRAGDEFSRHGCNDFELPNSQEVVDLLNAMEQWNVGPGRTPETTHIYDPAKKTLFTMDWYLMGYLRHRLLNEAQHETAIWNAAISAAQTAYRRAVSSPIAIIDEALDTIRR